jgi:hypothetical protein
LGILSADQNTHYGGFILFVQHPKTLHLLLERSLVCGNYVRMNARGEKLFLKTQSVKVIKGSAFHRLLIEWQITPHAFLNQRTLLFLGREASARTNSHANAPMIF